MRSQLDRPCPRSIAAPRPGRQGRVTRHPGRRGALPRRRTISPRGSTTWPPSTPCRGGIVPTLPPRRRPHLSSAAPTASGASARRASRWHAAWLPDATDCRGRADWQSAELVPGLPRRRARFAPPASGPIRSPCRWVRHLQPPVWPPPAPLPAATPLRTPPPLQPPPPCTAQGFAPRPCTTRSHRASLTAAPRGPPAR